MQKITPFLWFDAKAEEAVNFYTSVFQNSRIIDIKYWPEGSPFPREQVMTATFEINELRFYAFDAVPQFKFNPSISFFVFFNSVQELEAAWNKLSAGGKVMMPLDSYPWSEKYGWCQDPFGLNWQLMMDKNQGAATVPCLMFTKNNSGRAAEAIELYTSIFNNSEVKLVSKYEKGEPDKEGNIKHAQFTLDGRLFACMDSSGPHDFTFTEAISLFVYCETQEEIDYFWEKLIANGGQESMCGWLKDPFGVSWQIVPAILPDLLAHENKAKAERAMQAMMKMKKLIIADLENAVKE